MKQRRHKNVEWVVPETSDGRVLNWSYVDTCILLDIRDELREMNRKLSVLDCPNFIAIPSKLERIARHTTKPKEGT